MTNFEQKFQRYFIFHKRNYKLPWQLCSGETSQTHTNVKVIFTHDVKTK